jgi:EAL domain-containing protein (putative c-di-GMP-specific phosphodiesterase class I)
MTGRGRSPIMGGDVERPALSDLPMTIGADPSHAPWRRGWGERLRAAFDEERFVLFVQPVTPIHGSGQPRYELLLRMVGERGELIGPREFLREAERLGFMGEIDRWVLGYAVKLLHDHAAAGHDLTLAVNLSGQTMNDLGLAPELAAMLDRHPVPDGRLVIEVTETSAILNIAHACELARRLRVLGCRLALDDFGAGFASFYYLKHLEFDYIKIDGEFVSRLVDTPTDELVIRAVVHVARGLGTKTIAECVGDGATVRLLRELGVDYGQGYHFGRPAPLDAYLPPLPSLKDEQLVA